MKIANDIKINLYKSQNFKGKIIEFHPKQQGDKPKITSPTNPEYYRAMQGIETYGLMLDVISPDEKVYSLVIKNKDLKKFLYDENGKLNADSVQKFANMYATVRFELTKINKSEQEYYKSLLYEDSSNFSMQTGFDTNELAGLLYECAKKQAAEIPQKAYDRTIRLFQLSKTDNGYDFSSIDKKNHLIDVLDSFVFQFGDFINPDDLYNEVVLNGKKDDGSIDFDLLNVALEMVLKTDYTASLGYVINLAKTIMSKDPENQKLISITMLRLALGDFTFYENETYFQDLMNLCFDKNNKFDLDKASTLIHCSYLVSDWVANMQANTDFGSDKTKNQYFNCLTFAKEVIEDYFQESEDKEGNFNSDKISFKDYFASRTKNLLFL